MFKDNCVVYSEEVLESIDRGQNVFLTNCTIQSGATLDLKLIETTVESTIKVIRCSFEIQVNLLDVIFTEEVSFEGTEFMKVADFSGSAFCELDFSDARFIEIADFSECRFGKTLFTNALFHEHTSFSRVEFRDEVDFSRVRFKVKPEIDGAKFRDREAEFEVLRNIEVGKTMEAPKSKKVWVVHGRDEPLRRSIFSFLRAIGLEPIEFGEALALTEEGAPFIGRILDSAFDEAQAVVVLMTGDDEARLKKKYLKPDDPDYEKDLTSQPRPNVLFEAGMAFGKHPRRTILVQVGSIRPISDIVGRHVVRLDNSPEKRRDLARRLETARCDVNIGGTDWLSIGDFQPTE